MLLSTCLQHFTFLTQQPIKDYTCSQTVTCISPFWTTKCVLVKQCTWDRRSHFSVSHKLLHAQFQSGAFNEYWFKWFTVSEWHECHVSPAVAQSLCTTFNGKPFLTYIVVGLLPCGCTLQPGVLSQPCRACEMLRVDIQTRLLNEIWPLFEHSLYMDIYGNCIHCHFIEVHLCRYVHDFVKVITAKVPVQILVEHQHEVAVCLFP